MPWQPPRATAIGGERDLPVRRSEVGVVRRDDDVAGIHQREPESGNGAVNAPDHRMRHSMDAFDGGVQAIDHVAKAVATLGRRFFQTRREAADVAARHEMFTGAFDDHHAQRIVGSNIRNPPDQRVDHRKIERIERVGPVERQRRDSSVANAKHGVVHPGFVGQFARARTNAIDATTRRHLLLRPDAASFASRFQILASFFTHALAVAT
jgi:hypothetical protein